MSETNAWKDLVDGLGIGRHQLAHHLLDGISAPDWETQPVEFSTLVTPSTNASAKALLLRTTLAEERTYCLTVIGDKVTVLHGMTEPYELQALGGKFVAFAGDIRKVANQTIHPDLVELSGVTSRTAATLHFATKAVPVLDWDQMKEELESDATKTLVARAGPPTAQGTAPTVDVQQMLPVPAIIAALYLKPTPVRNAFMRGQSLLKIIPEIKQDNYKPLFDFLRAAATRDDTNVDRPSLESAWKRLDIAPDTPMEVRYFRMVGKILPSEATAPAPRRDDPAPPALPREAPETTKESEKNKYHDFQCRLIWSASGKQSDTFPVQTEASMPEFFQGLREHRGSNIVARQYIESAWNSHKSSERIPTPFVWSAQLVKDIRNLDFGASDIASQYELRGRGLSYYALGPPELFASGKFVRTSDDWRMFEQSERDGNLTLEERKSNQKAGELISGTPKDQMSTICHLEGVAARYNFFFTEQCPVVAYLLWFARKLSSDPTVAAWKEDQWKAFNWHVHIALRKVFTDCSNGIGKDQLAYLTRIQSDLNSGRRFSLDDCPPELRSRKRDAEEAGLGKPVKPPPTKNNEKEKSPPVTKQSPIAENFVTLCKSAKDATSNKTRFHLGLVLPKASDYHQVLGPEMQELSDSGNLCGRFFISQCTAKKCHFGHKLKSTPEKAVIEGMVKRFQEKVDAYVAAQASKE